MPNSRCIETGAREGVYLGSELPVDAEPGRPGRTRQAGRASRSCVLHYKESADFHAFLRLFAKLVLVC